MRPRRRSATGCSTASGTCRMRRSTWTRRTPRGSSPTAYRPTNTTACRATRTDLLRDRLPLRHVEDYGGQLLQDREQEFLPHDHILPRPQLLRRRDLHPQMRYLRFQSLFQRPDFHVGQQEFHGAPPFRSIPLIAPSAPSRKYLGIRAPLHPLPLRCASSPYSTVCL